jgi:pyrroloquinoline quinone (PQQ) biosynthesis protein C
VALPNEQFVRCLFEMVKERRSFGRHPLGRHPLWLKIAEGRLARDKLPIFAAQFFLEVREFPRAVSALHSR